LRFPIAEISKKTGYSEGVVSRYLNGTTQTYNMLVFKKLKE